MTLQEAIRDNALPAIRSALLHHRAAALTTIHNDRLLHFAVKAGRTAVVREFLRAGANPALPEPGPDWTPAFYAVERGRTEILRLLLESHPDCITHKDSGGRTLLHWAADQAYPEAVRLLLDAGADPNAQDSLEHETPLHRATSCGCAESVRLLLLAGANPNAISSTGETPLLLSAIHPHLIDMLLEAGANPASLKTALEAFAFPQPPPPPSRLFGTRSGAEKPTRSATPVEPGAFRLLRRCGGIDDRSETGFTRTHLVARAGDAHDLARLLAMGAYRDMSATDDGDIATMLAAENQSEESIHVLIQLGRDPVTYTPGAGDLVMKLHAAAIRHDQVGLRDALRSGIAPDTPMALGLTALHLAVAAGWPRGVELLLAAGASPQIRDARDWTALHHAVAAGRPDLLRRCIGVMHGVTAETGNDGLPVLHLAASLGETKSVEILLAAGVPVDTLNAAGETALHAAVRIGSPEVIRVLLAAGASPDGVCNDLCELTPLMLAVDHRRAVIRPLLQAGADPERRDAEGRTAWLRAVETQKRDAMRLLAMAGVNVNARDAQGRSALFSCITSGRSIELEHPWHLGTQLDLRDDSGGTVLHEIARLDQVALYDECVSLGANPNARDHRGRTPLDVAPRIGVLNFRRKNKK